MTSSQAPASPTLMAAVIGMGVLIVIGTIGLIGVIVHRAMAPKTYSVSVPVRVASQSSIKALPDGEAPQLVFAGGGRILSQAIRPDGTVSLHVSMPRAEEVVIWDPGTNRITARFVMGP